MSRKKVQKTVGILGGMGPEATAFFYHKIVQLTPARNDQDHLKTIILSNPKIPDRNYNLLNSSESPLPVLIDCARQLQQIGADFISMPCNTAHWFWPQLCEAVDIPVLNIIDETVETIKRNFNYTKAGSSDSHIGLLATDGTLQMKLYHRALLAAGLQPVVPEPAVQETVQRSIYWIKGGEKQREAIAGIQEGISHLQQQGASALIYGCTELTLIGDELTSAVSSFDSLEILAQATVNFALSGQPD